MTPSRTELQRAWDAWALQRQKGDVAPPSPPPPDKTPHVDGNYGIRRGVSGPVSGGETARTRQPAANSTPPELAGRRARRSPVATARIAAAAASSRARCLLPPSVPLLNLLFPAGSVTVRASLIACASSSDGTGTTRPSQHARRNIRTSAAPSRNPIPRSDRAAFGIPPALSASSSSPLFQWSAATATGRPNRSSAAASSSPTDTA